jgi:hypothetical protein
MFPVSKATFRGAAFPLVLPVGLPFSNQSVLTVFFRGSPFRNAGFFSKSRKPPFPLKRKSFGCPLQKIRPFLNPQAVVPHVFSTGIRIKRNIFQIRK